MDRFWLFSICIIKFYVMIINVLENDGIEFFFVNEVGVILCFFFKGDMVFVNVFNYFREIRCLRKILDEIFI